MTAEAAWTLTGKWAGSGRFVKRPTTLDMEHNCLRAERTKRGAQQAPTCGGTFVCPRCKRHVPWCFGCADDYPCDDCWAAAHFDEGERQ